MKQLKKKLSLTKETISNLTALQQQAVKGGATVINTCYLTCYLTCNPDECDTVTTSRNYCTELAC